MKFVSTLMVVTALLAISMPSYAQEAYPTKPVRVIVPFPPGGPIDAVGRPLMERLQSRLGQPFLFDFRPGGAAIIGTAAAARSEPDGYTILFTVAQHTINPSVHTNLPYDTLNDFVAVSQVAVGPFMLVVHPDVKAHNIQELIELAKASQTKLNYASAGIGSGFHLAAEQLKIATGIDMVHIPYKGGAPAVTDVVAGHVDLMIGSSIVAPHAQAKRLRMLGVTSVNRSSLLPDVPTLVEQGLQGFDVMTWFGIFAPVKTPKLIVERLANEIQKIVRTPEFAEHLKKFVLEPSGNNPEQFGEIVRREVPHWIKIAREAKIQANDK